MNPTDLQARVLSRLTDYPNACFLTDTQVILDPAEGTVLNLTTLLELLDARPDHVAADTVIDDYLTAVTRAKDAYSDGTRHLGAREILSRVTRLVFPAGGLPQTFGGVDYAPGLCTAWGLHDGDAVAAMPAEHLTHAVSMEEMERAARAKIRAYARGVSTERFFGGVIAAGGRQTSSLGLYPDFCARAVKLRRSNTGYFVAIPDVEHVLIVPADDLEVLVDMVSASFGYFAHASKPVSWFLYHHWDGQLTPLISDRGLTPSFELEMIHGPVSTWPILDDGDDGRLSA